MAMILESIAIGIRENTFKNFLYNVFVSHKTLITISKEIIDGSIIDVSPAPIGEFLATTIYKIEIFSMAAFICFLRIVTKMIILKMPAVLYLVVFDHYDRKRYKLGSSQGVFDAVIFTWLCILLVYCASITLYEVTVFKNIQLNAKNQTREMSK